MTTITDEFLAAEQTLLDSEGVVAESIMVDLGRLGGRARVLIAGDGPPALFVPGVMTGGAVFAGLVGRLSGYRCIMIDRPGTGLSPLPTPPPADLAAQQTVADDLLADVLDGLEIARSHVICTSMGGWTTFRSAAAHPDRFLRICALAYQVGARINKVPLSMRVPAPKRLLPRRIKAPRGIVRAMLKTAGMRSVINNGRFSDELLDWLVALLRHTDTFRNESRYGPRPAGPMGANDKVMHSPELLAKITTPVHLFWGTDDLFGDEHSAREFASKLVNAELQLVDGAGHAPWLDEPELAATAVMRHLAGC